MSDIHNKKRYSLILVNMSRSVHHAYKKMLQKNMIYNNNLQKNKNSKSKNSEASHSQEKIKPHSPYEDFLILSNQSSYPFGFTEQRFKWQNLEDKNKVVNPNDYYIRLKRIPMKNSFDGGFEDFFNNDKHPKYQRNLSMCNLYAKRNYGPNSQRVILPEKNDEIELKKGKKCKFLNRSSSEENGSSIKSLLDKTPININYRGKKYFKDLSFRQKGNLNIFNGEYNQVSNSSIRKRKKRIHYNDVIC